MDSYLAKMKLLLPLLGFDFLTPSAFPLRDQQIGDLSGETGIDVERSTQIESAANHYQLKSNRLKASMFTRDGQLVVVKGSQMSKDTSPSIGGGWVRIRNRLIAEKIVVDKGEYFEFIQDFAFNSASAAASVIRGRQSAGPRRWTHTISGKTYRQLLLEGIDP